MADPHEPRAPRRAGECAEWFASSRTLRTAAGAIDVCAAQRPTRRSVSSPRRRRALRSRSSAKLNRVKRSSISIGSRPTATCRRSSSSSIRSSTTRWESRASDIHIETRERDVQVKFRIDGALYAKVDPIDIAFHQTLISRIKVMSELDIAERRIPQDGRFRVRYKRPARWIFVCRSCRRSMAKTRSFVSSTRSRSTTRSRI